MEWATWKKHLFFFNKFSNCFSFTCMVASLGSILIEYGWNLSQNRNYCNKNPNRMVSNNTKYTCSMYYLFTNNKDSIFVMVIKATTDRGYFCYIRSELVRDSQMKINCIMYKSTFQILWYTTLIQKLYPTSLFSIENQNLNTDFKNQTSISVYF